MATFVGIVVGFLNVLVNTPAEPPSCRLGILMKSAWLKITLPQCRCETRFDKVILIKAPCPTGQGAFQGDSHFRNEVN